MKYYLLLLLFLFTIDAHSMTKNPRDPIYPSSQAFSQNKTLALVEKERTKVEKEVNKRPHGKSSSISTYDQINYKKRSETFAVLSIMLGVLCTISAIAVIRTHVRFRSQVNS